MKRIRASCPRKSGLTLTSWYPKAILFAQFFDYSTPRCYSLKFVHRIPSDPTWFIIMFTAVAIWDIPCEDSSQRKLAGDLRETLQAILTWSAQRPLMSRIHPIPWDYWSIMNILIKVFWEGFQSLAKSAEHQKGKTPCSSIFRTLFFKVLYTSPFW